MNNRQKVLAAMLAVVVVVLALVAFAPRPPTPAGRHLVGIAFAGPKYAVHRAWSDGTVEMFQVHYEPHPTNPKKFGRDVPSWITRACMVSGSLTSEPVSTRG